MPHHSDLRTASIGPRSKIATGPDMLAAAKWEFEASTEDYIQSLEKIVYPYQWGEYNLLVLPPSFPYGGMENPGASLSFHVSLFRAIQS